MQLGSAETYQILSQNGCITLDGVDDVEQFKGVQRAFDTVGMDAQMQMQVKEKRTLEKNWGGGEAYALSKKKRGGFRGT